MGGGYGRVSPTATSRRAPGVLAFHRRDMSMEADLVVRNETLMGGSGVPSWCAGEGMIVGLGWSNGAIVAVDGEHAGARRSQLLRSGTGAR